MRWSTWWKSDVFTLKLFFWEVGGWGGWEVTRVWTIDGVWTFDFSKCLTWGWWVNFGNNNRLMSYVNYPLLENAVMRFIFSYLNLVFHIKVICNIFLSIVSIIIFLSSVSMQIFVNSSNFIQVIHITLYLVYHLDHNQHQQEKL